MYRIRRFGVIKTATLVAVMYLLITLVFIVPFAILGVAVSPDNAVVGGVGIVLIGLVVSLLYAVFGWIFTAVACVLYNVAAGWVGGIEVQVEPVVPLPPPSAWAPTGAPPAG